MPITVKDEHSQGIIFKLTPEEKQISHLKERTRQVEKSKEELEKEVKELRGTVDKLTDLVSKLVGDTNE